jgi:hypothetical protein
MKRHGWARARSRIVGFCLGGGFALMLAPAHGYVASAVNYGDMSNAAWHQLAHACPIVASMVAIRRGLASAPGELPIWGTLLVVTTVIALVLLASIQRERVVSP